MVEDKIREVLTQALKELGYETESVHLEHPADLSHGDYSTNIAMATRRRLAELYEVGNLKPRTDTLIEAKVIKEKGKVRTSKSPKELAEKIVRYIEQNKPKEIEKVEVAGAGFINFHLSQSFFTESIQEILNQDKKWGSNETLKGKKVMIEYTDPNPFKELHIGHLMSNAIGESISRLIEFSGAEIKRANYQGDIGLHVAKAIANFIERGGNVSNEGDIEDLARGVDYTGGNKKYEEDSTFKKHAIEVNKQLYDMSNNEVKTIYEAGKKRSLELFQEQYKKLGTEFNEYFFESGVGDIGKKLVEKYRDVFEKSEGATVFRGEKHDKALHTRVFITSQGLPTYEAKELGLAKHKFDSWEHDLSVVITANEITDYYRVAMKALEQIKPELAKKIVHVPHGMLRLPSGKMSSRTGDVISAETLLDDLKEKVMEVMKDSVVHNKKETALQIAVGAIKYSVLKQAAGKDIIFDFEKALSFEGDSGPYLQYSNTRALSVLEKAAEENLKPAVAKPMAVVAELERFLYRFPEVVERATKEYEPHYVTTYLTQLAGVFNSWYAKERIIDESAEAPYKLALTKAFQFTMENGLWLLGIKAPKRM